MNLFFTALDLVGNLEVRWLDGGRRAREHDMSTRTHAYASKMLVGKNDGLRNV
jgi:hypothetical protein